MSNLPPVDIEFALKDMNFSAGIKKMKAEISGVTDYTQAASKAMTSAMADFAINSAKQMKESINIQKTVIRDLQQSIKELQNTATNSTGKNKTDAQSALGLAKKDLIAEQGALIAMQKEQTALNAREAESQIPIIGGLGKWLIGLASVAAAMKIGKDIIESTEATSHKFEQAINASTAATQYFFKAIASGDWSNFWDGLEKSVSGAIKLTNEMEKVERRTIEQEVKGAEAQKKIAELRAGTFDKGIENQDKLIKNTAEIVEIQKADYAKQAGIAKDKYEITRNQMAIENKMSSDKIEALTFEYTKNEQLLLLGEKYNEIKNKIGNGQKAVYLEKTRPEKYRELQDEMVSINLELQNSYKTTGEDAGKMAEKFEKPTLKALKSLADLKKNQVELEGQSKIGSRRDENALAAAINRKEKETADAAKKAKEDAELENRIKVTQEQMKTASGQELVDLAKKLTLLQAELKHRKEIYDLTMLSSWTDQFKGQSYQPIESKGISPIIQKGSTKTVQGIMYEVTAIDKTGPTWKKVKAEYSDLKKFEKEKDKEGTKDQEKLEEDKDKNKKKFQEDLLNYSRQFTGELITQLGLTKEQNAEMQSMADLAFNIMKINPADPSSYLSAAFSGASLILSAISGQKETDTNAMALERMNNLLKQQSAILSNLAGSNYFQLSKKQYDDLGKSIDLNTEKLKKSKILNITGVSDYYKDYDTDHFIKSFSAGILLLDDAQTETITAIIEARKQQSELLQETFRQALGFDSTEVSDSIVQGIQDGLKLSDNGLGGFAESFGEKIKKALVNNISDAIETTLNAGFMADMKSFLAPDSIGGTTLTPTELAILEKDYAAGASQGAAAYDAIKPILDKYGVGSSAASASATKGISASATEDSVSAMVGQLMGVRVDIKDILKQVAMGQDDVGRNLLYLKQISENTSHNVRLVSIESEMKEMNKILKDRL